MPNRKSKNWIANFSQKKLMLCILLFTFLAFGNLGTGTGKKSVFGGGGESNIGSSPFQPSKPVFGAVSFGGGNSAFGGSAKIGGIL